MAEPVSKEERTGRGALLTKIGRFIANAQGATALEYGLIAGLIFAVIAGSLQVYGASMNRMYERISTAVSRIN